MSTLRILVATTNAGKLSEIRQVLAGPAVQLESLLDKPALPPAVENGRDFAENARLKALHYAHLTGQLTLADDSGLEVDALDGAPGVHSARYAGAEADDQANCRKLLAELRHVPEQRRTARFRCCLCLAQPGQVLLECSGTLEGRIATSARGSNGFGYDPLFLLPDGRTVAELKPEEKNRISHRGQALRKLAQQLQLWLAKRQP